MDLRLDDGTTIGELSRPPQGLRHRVLFGVERADGRKAVAKIELIDGALRRELRVLELLAAADGPAPRVLGAGSVIEGDENLGAFCLVTERATGSTATTIEAWERLGRAVALLAEVPVGSGELPTVHHDEFLALHRGRTADFDRALGRDFGAALPAVPPAYSDSPLILTHGDPGPGNFVDGGAGTLLDWEDAHVAPRGLDLGRTIFIALLGGGPVGFVATDQAARAIAAREAFLAATDWAPDEDELRWWLAVAGVQFAHWRWERDGRPGIPPWRDAVAVLEAALDPPPDAGGPAVASDA
jgi:aminoglycoside phosphotransferase (APT) family kinase protein